MNKIAIPALLLGVVMIAGAFAFMPVQEASTVHLSAANTSNSIKYVTVSDTCALTAAGLCDLVTVDVTAGDEFELVGLSGNMDVATTGATKTLDLAVCVIGTDGENTGIDLPAFTTGNAAVDDVHDFLATSNTGVGSAITNEISCPQGTTTAAQTAGTLTLTFTFIMNGDATDPVVTIAQ